MRYVNSASMTDWKPLGREVKAKSKKMWIDNLLDGMKIMRMTNWMRKTRNREVWHKLVGKGKNQQKVVKQLELLLLLLLLLLCCCS